MKNSTSFDAMLSRVKMLLYRFVLPVVVAGSLLFISGTISRPLFLGTKFLDLLARIWLSLMFSMGYIIVSDLERYKLWFYGPNQGNVPDSPDGLMVFWNVVMGLMLAVFVAVISWWCVHTFLPMLDNVALILAFLNSLLFLAPLIYQRHPFLC